MGRSALGVAVQTPKFAQRARSASPTEGRRPPESGLPSALRAWLACPTDGAIAQNDSVVRQAVEDLFFVSLPRENVRDLQISMLTGNTLSWLAFNEVLQAEDRRMSRVKIAWHLTKDAESAAAIEVEGINCDEGHCSCGRYGRGGYVALSAAKANAYGWDGEEAERHLFAVLALPDLQLVRGSGARARSGPPPTSRGPPPSSASSTARGCTASPPSGTPGRLRAGA